MTQTMFALLPVLICAGMMFGGGVAAWFATRTPLRRLRSSARSESHSGDSASGAAA